MKNSNTKLDNDSQDIDLLLQMSAARSQPESTIDLQNRILSSVSEVPQHADPKNSALKRYVEKLSPWVHLPHVATAGLAFALVLAVTLWTLAGDVITSSDYQSAQSTQSVQADEEFEFSILSVQEAEMDVYEDVIWEELLLAEDELAFAML